MIALETDLIQRPDVTVREFKNLDAALDFCKFVEPKELNIRKIDAGYLLQYNGSEGML